MVKLTFLLCLFFEASNSKLVNILHKRLALVMTALTRVTALLITAAASEPRGASLK